MDPDATPKPVSRPLLPRTVGSEVDEELEFHLDVRTRELVEEGWEPSAARAEAERLFGNYQRIREECVAIGTRRRRQRGRMERMEAWIGDLRYGLRQLRRRPGFAALSILTLTMGIGASTAVFSVLYGVLLKPLPYETADRLVRVQIEGGGRMSAPDLVDIGQTASMDRLVAYTNSTLTITGQGEPFTVSGLRSSDGLLDLFGVVPAAGRDLRFHERVGDQPNEVVVGYGLWQRLFGGSPDAVGSTLQVNGDSYEIVGVAPLGFDYPTDSEVWVTRGLLRDDCERGCHTWLAVGTLAMGSNVERLQAEVDALAATLSEEYPTTNTEKTFEAVPLRDAMVGDVRRGLWLVLAGVLMVLLIACANVANLLLVRASDRTGEMAVRAALGATRTRLVRQTLLESLVLALLGAAGGLALAFGLVAVIKTLAADSIPRLDAIGFEPATLLFALLAVCGATLLFGLAPALRAGGVHLSRAMGGSARGTGSKGSHGQRRALVALEMALSVTLLVAAGLLIRTFAQLYSVDVGYETRSVTKFTLGLPESDYPDMDRVRSFYRALEERLSVLPGVESVGSGFGIPMTSSSVYGDLLVEGRPEAPPGQEQTAGIMAIGPDLLETLRIPVVRGRGLTSADDGASLPVALINETLARQAFADEDPIGQTVRVTVDVGYGSPDWTVVGVVGDTRNHSIRSEPPPYLVVPHGHFGPRTLTVMVRTRPGLAPSADLLKETVQALDRNLPLRDVSTIEETLAEQVAPTRFYLTLIAAFGMLAVLLAAVGLYGVLAYSVASRTREIGVRMAMGADARRIARLVVSEGLKPAAGGLVVGLIGALFAGRLLGSILYEVQPRDPLVLISVPAVLLLVSLLAIALPARRATSVDPAHALRSD